MGQTISMNFCKGCKWDKDHDNCPNDYKDEMMKYKNGRYKVGFCKWARPPDKMCL